MDKTANVFFEILLLNYSAITDEAQKQRETQNIRLYQKHSKDRTADAAMDNITGGQMTIRANGEMRRLRNLQQWANILEQVREYFDAENHKIAHDIFKLGYIQKRNNRELMKKLAITRLKLFTTKEEIKNLTRAAACEMGLWRAIPKKL